jgi:hypothetical protein
MWKIDDAPADLQQAIREFWPEAEWDNAASISFLESDWSAFATADTRDSDHPCGAIVSINPDGVRIAAEYSIGWFQINACNLPSGWTPAHLYNTRHNAGTAHQMWSSRGWSPWYFSAKQLGLIS